MSFKSYFFSNIK
ncbi:hypothetical protein FOXB_16620 [Fusarium oxysporum f. sp. conglutinans Fo5176]|uniref:Uncharacterized protein n=1 Tax=Fusarium oxysporum (strain Fo5176) TaxID=660025 RepID=F9GD86_FUSOF|nr:hypothetical protein FOXB_16620 [Fusarium oxysporum f. sp. conglutinans Fo5176]